MTAALRFVSEFNDQDDASHLTPAGKQTALLSLPREVCKFCGDTECKVAVMGDRYERVSRQVGVEPSPDGQLAKDLAADGIKIAVNECEERRYQKLQAAVRS